MMIRFFRYAAWVGAGMLAGCAAPPAPIPQGDWIVISEISIQSPAEVTSEEPIEVDVRYQLRSSDSALLQVRPFNNSALVPGHLAHVPIAVTAGTGEATASVTFSTDATVDEVRASLVTLPHYRILAEGRQSVDLTWRTEKDE